MIVVDDSSYPVVLVRFAAPPSSDDLRVFCEQLEAVGRRALQNDEYWVSISEGQHPLRAEHRRQLAAWMARLPSEIEQRCAGAYVVSKNPLVRAGLQALRWIAPKMSKVTLVSSFEEAGRAAEQALAGVGVTWSREALVPLKVMST